MTIQEQVKEIKQSFRQMMDGAVAQSMRDKGVNYHLNWGATLPRLREKADEIGKAAAEHRRHPRLQEEHREGEDRHPSARAGRQGITRKEATENG